MKHFAVWVLGSLLASIALAAWAAPDRAAGESGGIWKAVVPPRPMQAEFEGFDPVGIAAGARIRADCSLNWINPDDGVRHCFSSGTSLQYFLDRQHEMIARARASWSRMSGAAAR